MEKYYNLGPGSIVSIYRDITRVLKRTEMRLCYSQTSKQKATKKTAAICFLLMRFR